MYEFRNICGISFEQLANAANQAFSDYITPANFTAENIEARFTVSGVDYSRSFGAFYNGELVGLLVNSVDEFMGQTVAFDALTGIVPAHRGVKVFSRLFEHTVKSLRESGLSRYYLEVITTNERAFNIYSKKGMKIIREFTYMQGRLSDAFIKPADVLVTPLSDYDNTELSYYSPAFENRVSALKRNADDYNVASIETANGGAAVIYSSRGGVPQIRYNPADGAEPLFNVISYLLGKFEKLRIADIPVCEKELIAALTKGGIEVLVNQYEMAMDL